MSEQEETQDRATLSPRFALAAASSCVLVYLHWLLEAVCRPSAPNLAEFAQYSARFFLVATVGLTVFFFIFLFQERAGDDAKRALELKIKGYEADRQVSEQRIREVTELKKARGY